MQAITLEQGQYVLKDIAPPAPKVEDVLIKVAYAGVNRADLLQRLGKYPLPERTPAIPGLEVSGQITACGNLVRDFKVGDKVCALLPEGGFGEYATAHISTVLPVPERVSLENAAALPEACFTSWISLAWQARLRRGEVVVIHGGASGIGTIAIQMARMLGARIFATAGTQEKCDVCQKLGAERAILHTKEDFVSLVKNATDDKGADVVLDMVGGDYVARNMECLTRGGRLCTIAFLRGSKITLNLSPILLKNLSIMGSTLRTRPLHEKARITAELRERVWPTVALGTLKPVIDRVFPLAEATKALQRMEEGLNIGKILLKM